MTDRPHIPAVPLLPYQRAWISDRSRFKFGLWARQTGKSFSSGLDAVLDAVSRKTLWVLLSRGQRQSNELMRKVRDHLRAIRVAGRYAEFLEPNRDSREEIELPNGSRVIALPANPDTARGYSGNILLDEFDLHPQQREIWAAIYGTITRSRDYRLVIITTPKGQQRMAYQIWSDPSSPFSKHKVTIEDAAAAGLDVDVAELRRGLNDEDLWRQEYLCEFVDEATAYLTYELLLGLEAECPADWDPKAGPLYLGVDVGRRRDLTAMWLLQQVGDVWWTRRLVTLEKQPFSVQEAQLDELMRLGVSRCCIDATGLGMQLAERAVQRWGSYRVEGVTFSNQVKADLAGPVLVAAQDRRLRIPVDPAIRADLHSVKRVVTSSGNIRFDAERSEDGHADRFWALALARHAAGDGRRAAWLDVG